MNEKDLNSGEMCDLFGQHAPRVEIVEQPAPKAIRFRYKSETFNRSAGSIPGINSTSRNKTFPTIQIKNYTGKALVVVSCVTKDPPYKIHPHQILGDNCENGICKVEINPDKNMTSVFRNLGIQCVRRNEIEEALRNREKIRHEIDPFRNLENHQPFELIDLDVIRLCFQLFLEDLEDGRYAIPMCFVVSEPIYDKKAATDLVITKLSHCSASCYGGQEVILLCEKVTKDDIKIIFYEENYNFWWEAEADFTQSDVHKQVAIKFKTPRYRNIDIKEPVRVKVQLRRLSNNSRSEPVDFEMLPLDKPKNTNQGLDQSKGSKKEYNTFMTSPQPQHNNLTFYQNSNLLNHESNQNQFIPFQQENTHWLPQNNFNYPIASTSYVTNSNIMGFPSTSNFNYNENNQLADTQAFEDISLALENLPRISQEIDPFNALNTEKDDKNLMSFDNGTETSKPSDDLKDLNLF